EGVVIRLSRNILLRAQITLSGARRARFRLTDSNLVVGDNLGRLIALDLSTGTVSRNHRLF
ncbi:MAG: hypothetical protein KY445_11810, partial [Armatimonadetes bacterium]|nr:hypothetical protein [Armatimonadota bacterium]